MFDFDKFFYEVVTKDVRDRPQKYKSNYDHYDMTQFDKAFSDITLETSIPIDARNLRNFLKKALVSRIQISLAYGYFDLNDRYHNNDDIIFSNVDNNYEGIDLEQMIVVPFRKCNVMRPNVRFCDIGKLQANQEKIKVDASLTPLLKIRSNNYEDDLAKRRADSCESIGAYTSGTTGFAPIRLLEINLATNEVIIDRLQKIYRYYDYQIDATSVVTKIVPYGNENELVYSLFDVDYIGFPVPVVKIEKLSLIVSRKIDTKRILSATYKRLLYDAKNVYENIQTMTHRLDRGFLAPGLTIDLYLLSPTMSALIKNLFINVKNLSNSLIAGGSTYITGTIFDFFHCHISYNYIKDEFIFVFHLLEFPYITGAPPPHEMICNKTILGTNEMEVGSHKFTMYESDNNYSIHHNILMTLNNANILKYYTLNQNIQQDTILTDFSNSPLALDPQTFGYQFADLMYDNNIPIGASEIRPSMTYINQDAIYNQTKN